MSKKQRYVIEETKIEAMALLAQGIVIDFKPLLEEIKILIKNNGSVEIINQKIDILLKLLNQLESFSLTQLKRMLNK